MMKLTKAVWLIGLFILLLVGCLPAVEPPADEPATPTIDPDEPVSSDDPTPTMEPTPAGVITGLAMVDQIEILTLESFPVQIHVRVMGSLPDGCTSVGAVHNTLTEQTFRVEVQTTRPADRMCTQQIVPFEQTVPLDVAGLAAGTYTVDVNGVTGTFTLSMDN